MFNFMNKRSIYGFSESGKRWPYSIDLSCLLTKYKNYCNDEYSTVDDSGMSVPPMACRFARSHSKGHVLSVVDEDGFVVLYNVNKMGQEAVMKSWQVHSNAVFDVEWVEDDSQILTASGDQTVALWDVEKMTKLESFRGHSSSVRSISLRPDDNAVFASGSRDGHIMIWDKRVAYKDGAISSVNAIYNAHALQQSNTPGKVRKKKHLSQPKDGQQSVTAVLFQNENQLVSAGSVDGCIKVWDIRKTYKMFSSGATPVHVLHYQGASSRKHGYSSLSFDQSRCRLFASCTDDVIYEYNLMSTNDKPVHCFRGHKNSSFYVKTVISPNNQFLLSGSTDHHAYIWQINKPEAPPTVLKAHDAEVSGVDWCHSDFTKLATLSDDGKTKFWRIFSRELKSNLHPQWFGRARKFSRDRSTSTVDTAAKMENPQASTSSPIPSPLTRLDNPPVESSSMRSPMLVSKSPSVREWLKRKNSVNLDGLSEPSSSKTPCLTPSKRGAQVSTDEVTSPLARPKSMTDLRKRTLDMTKTVELPPSDCGNDEKADVGSEDGVCNQKGSGEMTPTKKAKRDDGHDAEFGDPVPTSCFSPVKPDRSHQRKNAENIHHPSPQKLKHKLSLTDSPPPSSPKRPCLTNLNGNGAFHRPSCVKSLGQTLFGGEARSDCDFMKEEKCDVSSARKDLSSSSNDISPGLPKPKMYPDSCTTAESDNLTTGTSPSVSNHQSSNKLVVLNSPENLNSPTHNLPNLVKDQLLGGFHQNISPHRMTPPQAKRIDWLTQFRRSKTNKCDEKEEPVNVNRFKRQTPSPARSSPKMSPNVQMRNIQAYFTSPSGKGNG